MPTIDNQIEELVGKSLRSFRILRMTEVHQIDSDGHRGKVLGCFTKPEAAKVFASMLKDAGYHALKEVFVLVDEDQGDKGFRVTFEPVEVRDNQENDLRRGVLSRLSPEERDLLGFKEPVIL
jgi:hypothetical protein